MNNKSHLKLFFTVYTSKNIHIALDFGLEDFLFALFNGKIVLLLFITFFTFMFSSYVI